MSLQRAIKARCPGAPTGLLPESRGSLGGSSQDSQTYGCLGYITTAAPAVAVFENLDHLADPTGNVTDEQEEAANSGQAGIGLMSHSDVLMAEMAARGYDGQRFILDAKEFGAPCRQRRLYVVFIRLRETNTPSAMLEFSQRSIMSTFATLRRLVGACRRTPPPLEDCLLPETNRAVVEALRRRIRVMSLSVAWTRGSCASARLCH